MREETLPVQSVSDLLRIGEEALNQGDCSACINHLDRLIPAVSQVAYAAYAFRGIAKAWKGDLVGAVSDYNILIKSDWLAHPTTDIRGMHHSTHVTRGLLFLACRAWVDAITDFSNAAEIAKTRKERLDDACLAWIGRRHLGQNELADYELAEAARQTPEKTPDQPAMLFLGQISEVEFVAAFKLASSNADAASAACEACYYVGIKSLFDGKFSVATSFFRRCVAPRWEASLIQKCAESELIALGVPISESAISSMLEDMTSGIK